MPIYAGPTSAEQVLLRLLVASRKTRKNSLDGGPKLWYSLVRKMGESKQEVKFADVAGPAAPTPPFSSADRALGPPDQPPTPLYWSLL
jgi:hypothetical protein